MAINNLVHDVLILGGGHAGVRAARELIQHQLGKWNGGELERVY